MITKLKNLIEKYRCSIYIFLILIVLVFFGVAYFLPATQTIIRTIIMLPGVAAASGIVYQLLRDRLAHDRKIVLLNKQQNFDLGVASHMASIAYDKHVSFCEEYIQCIHECFSVLMQEGVTENVFKLANNLTKIRLKHSAWITLEIENKLFSFENILRQIGVGRFIFNDLPVGEQHTKEVKRVFGLFNDLIKSREFDKDEDKDKKEATAIYNIIDYIRNILGINELTELRSKIIQRAKESISK